MSLCAASAVLALGFGVSSFDLRWTHSVEKTEWQESWRIEGSELVLDQARVRGSGAGMEPPPGAVLQDSWWVYRVERRTAALNLAVSNATGSGWQLCTALGCQDLEVALRLGLLAPAEISLSAGPRCRPKS